MLIVALEMYKFWILVANIVLVYCISVAICSALSCFMSSRVIVVGHLFQAL